MMTSASRHRVTRIAFCGMLTAAFLIGGAGMSAQADDDDDAALDVKIFRSILKSFGLRRDEAGIDYRERSPLVVPPSRNLPSPEANAAANRGAAWPNDPDLQRAREARAARAASNPDPVDRARPLLPSQYNSRAPARPGSEPDGKDRDTDRPMTPAQLGAPKSLLNEIWRGKEEYVVFGGEPSRSTLTQPPVGYRTPSPTQPYGVGKQRWDGKPTDRHEVQR